MIALVMWGIPDFYFTCRARLVELQASKALELLPLALLKGTPVRLAQANEQLFLPISGLAIPQSQVSWDAETKTATLDLARRITLASSRSVAVVDGASVKLSAPPIIEDGRLMISVRDVKPLLGLTTSGIRSCGPCASSRLKPERRGGNTPTPPLVNQARASRSGASAWEAGAGFLRWGAKLARRGSHPQEGSLMAYKLVLLALVHCC